MYYQAPDGSLHYLENDAFAYLLPVGSTPISDDKAKELRVILQKKKLTKIYKSDIWRKATDAESVTIKAGLLQQPVRLQELWTSVSYISTTDELYAALRDGFVAAFGEARTNELLEATE